MSVALPRASAVPPATVFHGGPVERAQRERWPLVALAAATLIALGLRLALTRSVWVDEAITVHQVHMSLPAMLHDLRATDNHPPLSYLLTWAAVRLFGYGDLAIHLPAIVEGTLLVPAMYLAARDLFGRRTAVTAAVLIAVAPLAVWYAQEARDYALFMLLATLSVWAQVKAVRDGRARFWIAYGVLIVGLAYTHYFALLPIAVEQVAFAAVIWRRAHEGEPVRGLLVAIWVTWLAVLVALLPLAPFAATQIRHDQLAGTGFSDGPSAVGQSSGSSLSIYAVLSNLTWAVWGYHSDATMLRLAALWPLMMLLTLALLGRGRRPELLYVAALAFLPMAVLLLLGLEKRNLFEVRYFVASVPMAVMLCARGVNAISARRGPVLLATGAILATMGLALADEQLNQQNPRRYDFAEAVAAVSARARPGAELLYAPTYLEDVFLYYRPGVRRAVPLRTGAPPRTRGAVFLLASFLNEPRIARQVGEARYALARAHGRPTVRFRTDNIEVYEYR